MKTRIQAAISNSQNKLQRGFTAGASPLNAALILEECYRESKDTKNPITVVMLDAKSAFDVVNHESMMRRLYHIGITNDHWSLINSLHTNATTAVKWKSLVSEPYRVHQGIRQGGILSADLYKLYVDPLLHQLQNSQYGMHIGDISCPATACADDVTLNSTNPNDTQIMIDMAFDFSLKQQYKLQPTKSVIIETGKISASTEYRMGNTEMKTVKSATHLGIQRSTSIKNTIEETVNENIKKARRTAYSLLSAGLHGNNGLDPETSLHLLKSYVLPVLLYGLEVIIPATKFLQQLEIFHKQLLKQILSLPQNTADPAPYILSGLLPVQEQLHIKILNFFNNICNQKESSVEKRIARRQLTVKNMKSTSWFIEVKRIFWTYDLGDPYENLDHPPSKSEWKKLVIKSVSSNFQQKITSTASLYKSLRFMNIMFTPGKIHPNIGTRSFSLRESNRLAIKTKLLTSTYICQSNRAAFNQKAIDPTCQLCLNDQEDITHFILHCKKLQNTRTNVMQEIISVYNQTTSSNFELLSDLSKIKIILDYTHIQGNDQESLQRIEYHCRRLLYQLHTKRYRALSITKPKRSKPRGNIPG